MQNSRVNLSVLFLFLIFILSGCSEKPKTVIAPWVPYDESEELAANAENESIRLQYKLIQSQVNDKNIMLKSIESQLGSFGEDEYQMLYSIIYEQDILSIQGKVDAKELSYEDLVKWYLYRISIYENNKDTYLNAIISVNPNVVAEARDLDKNRSEMSHPIYGIPVLLKDNINFNGLPTTAGAHALINNNTEDAFITSRIKSNGGLILGKTSLSEWANYLCIGCPNGYSAVGGQTLNPYGRKQMDTGGSSSGSGAAVAANYATVAVGTETSGSILSPSSGSSLVGLKPTVGLLSRGGIVPISSTLDTPGPMTKTVMDNAILLDAMTGEDSMDDATKDNPKNVEYWQNLTGNSLEGLRFGVNTAFLSDSVYRATVSKLSELGAETIEFDPKPIEFRGFGAVLRGDMIIDLADYLKNYGGKDLPVSSVEDVVNYNLEDSLVRIPYGQGRFAGILDEEIAGEELEQLKASLKMAAREFFDEPMAEHNLDAVLSVNNRGAGFAAAALYPCLTVPMGYNEVGKPMGLTFIAKSFQEDKLIQIAYAFENGTTSRIPPANY